MFSAVAVTLTEPPFVFAERVTEPAPDPEAAPDIFTVPPPEAVNVTVAFPVQVTVFEVDARGAGAGGFGLGFGFGFGLGA
ncbi:hypothetical protein GCG21_08570 [Pseudactinotalea sp. HY160]|uniref:hypothetical protein n=1 Tax=Pseudactinotalea sp. HY160 TaxID=2654490 RepID=UPI00128D6F0F|nr:hypothetical protein [Pseudactinotalea sp. HY160]MPV50057.1 hypothetical protein [Pseudactinotalea sp. HY160]